MKTKASKWKKSHTKAVLHKIYFYENSDMEMNKRYAGYQRLWTRKQVIGAKRACELEVSWPLCRNYPSACSYHSINKGNMPLRCFRASYLIFIEAETWETLSKPIFPGPGILQKY